MKRITFSLILFLFILNVPIIPVQSQEITYPDLNKIFIYTIPDKEYLSVSNVSDSDYTIMIVTYSESLDRKIDIINEYYPYLNNSQIEILWVFLGRIESYNDYIYTIEHYNISSLVCVTEDYESFYDWQRQGTFVILFDQINNEVLITYDSLTQITSDEILFYLNQLGITFINLPSDLSKSVYKPKKTSNIGILIFIPILFIIWRRRILNDKNN